MKRIVQGLAFLIFAGGAVSASDLPDRRAPAAAVVPLPASAPSRAVRGAIAYATGAAGLNRADADDDALRPCGRLHCAVVREVCT